MKQYRFLLLLIFNLLVFNYSFSQCPGTPNFGDPVPFANLEQVNQTIAECFAPTFHQLTQKVPIYSPDGKGDLIVSVTYDDIQTTGNNWESLNNFNRNELLPKIYYSVVYRQTKQIIKAGAMNHSDFNISAVSSVPEVFIDNGTHAMAFNKN